MRHLKWLGPSLLGVVAAALLLSGPAPGRPPEDTEEQRAYRETVRRTAAMVSDAEAVKLAQKHGLQVLNLTWEDTGRFKNSAVGPNISDMTIQVQYRDPDAGGAQLACMPVIRHPNFSDLTGDVALDQFGGGLRFDQGYATLAAPAVILGGRLAAGRGKSGKRSSSQAKTSRGLVPKKRSAAVVPSARSIR